jgi:hypothetical protein
MSRGGMVDTVEIAPSNNAFTALAAAAVVANLAGLIILWLKAKELFGGNGLW